MLRRRAVVRRGPGLLGMAAVGGVAYAAGRGGANRAAQEQMQDQQIADLQAQQAAPPQPAAAAPQPAVVPQPAAPADLSSDERLRQLRELGELKSSGVLTDEEFQREKARLLGTT
jgi:hypothetical protein